MLEDFRRQWLGTAFLATCLAGLLLTYFFYAESKEVCAPGETWAPCTRNWIQALGVLVAVIAAAFAFGQMRAAGVQAKAAIEQATAAAFPIAVQRKTQLRKLRQAASELHYFHRHFIADVATANNIVGNLALSPQERGALLANKLTEMCERVDRALNLAGDPDIDPAEITSQYSNIALDIMHQCLILREAISGAHPLLATAKELTRSPQYDYRTDATSVVNMYRHEAGAFTHACHKLAAVAASTEPIVRDILALQSELRREVEGKRLVGGVQ